MSRSAETHLRGFDDIPESQASGATLLPAECQNARE
jgi:hypothetical protein